MESIKATNPVRIFLVGLSEAFSRSLVRYVGTDVRVVLIGVAPSIALGSILLPHTGADLVLLNWATLNEFGEASRLLRAGRPALRIVCVANEGEEYRNAAVQAGADAVISADGLAAELDVLLWDLFPGRFGEPGGRNG